MSASLHGFIVQSTIIVPGFVRRIDFTPDNKRALQQRLRIKNAYL